MSNIAYSKKTLFKHYLSAVSYLAKKDFDYRKEIEPDLKEFFNSLSEKDFDQLFEIAEKKFGNHVKIADKLFFMEKLEAIHKILRIFLILTIISIVLGIISALSLI